MWRGHIHLWNKLFTACTKIFPAIVKYNAIRSAHTKGLVPTTSPGDQVPSCELPIFIKKFSRRDQNLVPATCPTNSNHVWIRGTSPRDLICGDKSPGLVPANYAGPCVWTVRGTSPCDQMKISRSRISIFAPKTPHELRFKMAADGEVDKYFSFVCI